MNLSDSIIFTCGQSMKNRFMLAPLTNRQSHENGILSQDEFNWLAMRAKGNFGLVMTCASHVSEIGKGFPGQLGIFSDVHIEGHARLAEEIKSHGGLSVVQLHHAGMRSPQELIGEAPVCPSNNEKFGARALTHEEVLALKEDFVEAAIRSQKAGHDGVEVHGAHGYILTQFLSSGINHRSDEYGGSLENRSRLIFEIVDEIREVCGPEFLLGIRLSPERFGMDIAEVREVSQQLIDSEKIDFLDISLWDYQKEPEDDKYKGRSLLSYFTDLNMNEVKLTVAGKIYSSEDVHDVLEAGADFVSIGKAGILHHDFPKRVMSNEDFQSIETPVSVDYLKNEGLGDAFVDYMKKWPGFVED